MAGLLVCPDLERYDELAGGRAPVAAKQALLDHLKGCEACARKVATLWERSTHVGLLRGARTFCEGHADEAVIRLVERLSKLNPRQAPARPDVAHALAPPAALTFDCSTCHAMLRVPPGLAGKQVQCPQCKEILRTPGPETPAVGAGPGNEASCTDGPTLAPSLPSSTTEPEPGSDARPIATVSDTIGQDGDRNVELTAFLSPAQVPGELGRLGTYRILAILGAGGMGVVYKAEDPALKRLVALKAMLPGLGASNSARKRFLREARLAAAVKHDHIVSIYQVGEERGVPYLAMEFLIGEPLDARLNRRGPGSSRPEPLPLPEIVRIGCEMAEGLSAAHEAGLIHRDIKPANVWLEGKKARVKILDFGLARATAEEQHLTQSGAIVGTPAYMAPEQAQGKPVDHRCDLFSLGVVLYRMCTGQLPFRGADPVSTLMAVSVHEPPPPAQLNAQLPPALSELVMKLLAKAPAQRIGSAAEVAQMLTDLQRHAAPPAGPPIGIKVASPVAEQHADTIGSELRPAAVPAGVDAAPAPRRSKRAVYGVAALAGTPAMLCALLIGGVVVYQLLFRTDNGTLVVEVAGKDADLRFRNGKLHIYDAEGKKLLYSLAPSERNKSLPFGKYRIKVEGGDGVVLDSDNFEMTQKGWKVSVRVAPNAIAQKGFDKDHHGADAKPLKPVAEPGVLDFMEIHDADEKTFDAWIGQAQKDGFRPVNLNTQVVKDLPRYTAVAIKEEKKRIWEFARGEEGPGGSRDQINDHITDMFAKNFGATVQSVFRQAGKHRAVVIWLWNMPRTGIWTGNKWFIDTKVAEDVPNKYRPIYRGAHFHGDHIDYSVLLGPDDGTPMSDVDNLPLNDCKALIEKRKADGWRPTNLYVYGTGPKMLFGVTFIQEKDRPDWDISWSLTPAAYDKELQQRRSQGFRPATAVGYTDATGAQRFSTAWVRYRAPKD